MGAFQQETSYYFSRDRLVGADMCSSRSKRCTTLFVYFQKVWPALNVHCIIITFIASLLVRLDVRRYGVT